MITAQIAWSMRSNRGLLLPPEGEYAHPRLKEIAVEQTALQKQMDVLDSEIARLARK
jgi:hypothetical protein